MYHVFPVSCSMYADLSNYGSLPLEAAVHGSYFWCYPDLLHPLEQILAYAGPGGLPAAACAVAPAILHLWLSEEASAGRLFPDACSIFALM